MNKIKLCLMCGKQHRVINDGEWGTIYCCGEKNFNLYDGLFYKI